VLLESAEYNTAPKTHKGETPWNPRLDRPYTDGYLLALKGDRKVETRLALLHTATANAVTFDRLGAEIAPDIKLQHVVDDSLLSEARASGGITPNLNRRVATAALNALDSGAGALLCTCSSIGPCAEIARSFTARPILRIDDPMATEAVAAGSRIIVAATLQTTLTPTKEIVQRAADSAGKSVELIEVLCDSAWAAFESGDPEGYETEIVSTLSTVTGDADVIVLAQASMAGAAEKLTSDVPVLTSPRSGFTAAAEIFRTLQES
jgi:Asp/Glu/hydantoin racemase